MGSDIGPRLYRNLSFSEDAADLVLIIITTAARCCNGTALDGDVLCSGNAGALGEAAFRTPSSIAAGFKAAIAVDGQAAINFNGGAGTSRGDRVVSIQLDCQISCTADIV